MLWVTWSTRTFPKTRTHPYKKPKTHSELNQTDICHNWVALHKQHAKLWNMLLGQNEDKTSMFTCSKIPILLQHLRKSACCLTHTRPWLIGCQPFSFHIKQHFKEEGLRLTEWEKRDVGHVAPFSTIVKRSWCPGTVPMLTRSKMEQTS